MTDSQNEQPLAGGNINAAVVRVGDTVRRATGPHSSNVHRLLQLLETSGFADAPRFLGIDPQGRETLSYIDGTTAFPAGLWTGTDALDAAVDTLRRFHDATAGMDVAPADGWAYCYPDADRWEVVCHNDFAPYNMVFEGELPVGIIDFDLAGPGPRLRDLAYLAYWLVPLSFGSDDLKQLSADQIDAGSPRLRRLCRAYGTEDITGLLDMVSEVLQHMGSAQAAIDMVGVNAAEALKDGGHFDHWQAEAAAFDRVRPALPG